MEGVSLAEYPSAPFEARDGVLWIATAFEGLLRYDGEKFVRFTEKDGLASDSIRDVHEDSTGKLWFATTGGVSSYDGKSFTTLTEYEAFPGIGTNTGFGGNGGHRDIWDVRFVRGGELWIATLDGVFRHDGMRFQHYPLAALEAEHAFEFSSKMVYSIFEDKAGVLWFCTDGAGVIRDDGSTQTVFTTKDGLCSNFICEAVQDARGDLWFGSSNGGVSRFDGETFTTHLRSEEFSDNFGWGRFMDLLVDDAGQVWFAAVGRERGAYRFDGKSFRHFTAADGLGDGHIASVREDRSGNIWFGTTAGIYRYDGKSFFHLTRGPMPGD
jgi:ligand-binding sensor domain-containing protein